MARSVKNTTMRAFGVGKRVGHDSTDFYKRAMFDDLKEPKSKNASKKTAKKIIENPIDEKNINTIHLQSSEAMTQLPDNSVHLMVTSPPYNVGKEYDDNLSAKEFRDMLYRVWEEVYRVLVDGGRACINVANIGRKPYIPLNSIITTDMLDIGFLMRGEIIWNKAASSGASCAWGSWCSPANPVLRDVHEYILVFSKSSFGRSKPTDKNKVATISKEDFLESTKSIWTFHAESAKKVGHPAPYPVELPQRFVQLYTYTEDLVLDPFMGSGTTGLAAQRSGRFYVGYETNETYLKIAQNRLNLMNSCIPKQRVI